MKRGGGGNKTRVFSVKSNNHVRSCLVAPGLLIWFFAYKTHPGGQLGGKQGFFMVYLFNGLT